MTSVIVYEPVDEGIIVHRVVDGCAGLSQVVPRSLSLWHHLRFMASVS